jgi:cytoskeletal protein CcmA (bactofilin family)
LPIESGLVGGSDSPPKRRKDRFQSDPQNLTNSVSPGREVVDTAFGALNSCGRTEEVYPSYARTDGTCGRRQVLGDSTTPPAAKPLTQPPPNMADIPPNKNNLSKDVEIKGSLKFENEFVFDGKLQGQISSVDGILTVGENADVGGEVKSKTVIVKGKVHGNITVQERCELHSHSQLIGDLKAARLVIEEGATFVGKSEVTPNKNIIKDLGAPPPRKEELQKVGAPR